MTTPKIKAALYARFSSDQQNAASAEDQLRLCADQARRNGWHVVAQYKDEAISGGTMLRPGLQRMLDDAKAGKFTLILTEALDRIARDQEGVSHIYKRLDHAQVELHTIANGRVGELHIGFEGTMAALQRKDLKKRIRRGQIGAIARGRSPAGVAYGYDVVREFDAAGDPVRGKRTINPEQADVVKRIFQEYAAGLSGREIATGLNADGFTGPRNGPWSNATITGNKERETGILRNRLYIGKLSGGRTRKIINPDTERETIRVNAKDQWVESDVPHLQIIDQPLWDAVQARLANRGVRGPGKNRTRYLLSGLVKCASCGGNYIVRDSRKLGCANFQNRGTCTNNRTIKRIDLEDRVFHGLRQIIESPEGTADYVAQIRAQKRKANHKAHDTLARLERAVRDIEGKISRLVTAIENAVGDVPAIADRILALEEKKATAQGKLDSFRASSDATDSAMDRVVQMHPNAHHQLAAQLTDLRGALDTDTDPLTRVRAMNALRSMIDQIVITPGTQRGQIKVDLYGELASVLKSMANHDSGSENITSTTSVVEMVRVKGIEPPLP